MSASQFVIVGASLAGAKAAETLRDEGFTGRIVLIGEEPDRPYERPPLSKDYLRGEFERQKVYVHDEGWYADQDIELRTSTRASELVPAEHSLVLETGEKVHYDRLLLATGGMPRRLTIPGNGLDGVYYLRTIADADRLAGALRQATNVAVVGAGWVGVEVAACARQLGCDVTMIDPAVAPLERAMGAEVGAIYRDLHVDHGVKVHLGTGVGALRGAGRVEEIRLDDETKLAADLVVVGIGTLPRIGLALGAGLTVNDGVAVDEHLRSSDPDIFAAGDVACAWNPAVNARIRVEHWSNALHQGPAAAKNMLGIDTPYVRLPYFFSDQYDFSMEYNGYAPTWDRVVLRGEPASGKFLAFWLDGGRIAAGMNVNIWDAADSIKRLIRGRFLVDPDQLADPDVSLETLVESLPRS